MEGTTLGPREVHYLNHKEHMQKKPMKKYQLGTLALMKNIQLERMERKSGQIFTGSS